MDKDNQSLKETFPNDSEETNPKNKTLIYWRNKGEKLKRDVEP